MVGIQHVGLLMKMWEKLLSILSDICPGAVHIWGDLVKVVSVQRRVCRVTTFDVQCAQACQLSQISRLPV